MEKTQKSGFGIVGIIIILVAIVALGGGFLYWREFQRLKNITAPPPAPATQNQQVQQFAPLAPPAEVDTSNWKTYRNEKYGVEFLYPREFQINARMFYSPEEPPLFKVFLNEDINVAKNLIVFTLNSPLEGAKSGSCAFTKDIATHYLKTLPTSVGNLIICSRTMEDLVYFDTLIPSSKIEYAYTVSMFADIKESPQRFAILEQILSTFKLIE